MKKITFGRTLSQHLTASVFYSPVIMWFGFRLGLMYEAFSLCLLIALAWELKQKFIDKGNNNWKKMLEGFVALSILPIIILISLIINQSS